MKKRRAQKLKRIFAHAQRPRSGPRKPADERVVVMAARMARGPVGATPEALRAMADHPAASAQIGMAMLATLKPDEVTALWSLFCDWCAAEQTYATRILGARHGPTSSGMSPAPDRVDAVADLKIDTRNSEEKDQDAVRSWMRWRGILGHLSAAEQTALHQARRENGRRLWRDRNITEAGRQAVAALQRLADVATR